MNESPKEYKTFLEEQLQWCRERDRILEQINEKLHEMKRIVEYTLEYEPTSIEIDELNDQLNKLKHVVHSLEKQLQSVIH
ncbi:hypothetical protein [Pseudobacillus wudalianchiensis]|uniref:Uncharacterized protein n=1 Tax=Pseudobacillus wudalianchiensis TaxID=1743143 RepID=A0A1B9AZ59_9BACI|nr:hypothetical protein [Bacillus wudalianchiensis]OCA89028.1 hypothetical protein A8F95_06335 [Bacillus wudalianchiensis]